MMSVGLQGDPEESCFLLLVVSELSFGMMKPLAATSSVIYYFDIVSLLSKTEKHNMQQEFLPACCTHMDQDQNRLPAWPHEGTFF